VTLFSGSQVLDEYYNGSVPSSPDNEYIYAGNLRVAIIQSGTSTYYWHNDHLSPRVRTDSSGNIADQRGTFPFGETWYTPNSSAPWVFTTYYRDVEAEGNDYAQARTYVAGLGRFSSPDLVAGSTSDPQSLNRYSYVRNTPVLLTDPFGLTPNCNVVKKLGNGADTSAGGGPSAELDDLDADPPQNGCGEIDCNYTIEGCPVDDGFGGGGGGVWGTQSGFGNLGFGLWDFGSSGGGGLGDGGILGWLGGGSGEGGFGSSGDPFGIPFGPNDPCWGDADGSLAALGACGQPCLVGGQPGICVNSRALGGGGGTGPRGDTTSWQWFGTATASFFKDFSVFGSANDPRPSCFGGFLRGTFVNFFGYSGGDVAGAVATTTYILTPPAAVPPTMALRGGKFARNWINASEASRLRGAASTGLLANLDLAEGLALADEIEAAMAGTCK
ncbi:MAG: RHS repeat-associated core domain-containing protein, partial [Candidatus Acidiferrum sp.]